MNRLLLVVLVILALTVGAAVLAVLRTGAVEQASTSALEAERSPDLDRLVQRVAELTSKVERLERARGHELAVDRSPARSARPSAPLDGAAHDLGRDPAPDAVRDARWYLDQYVLSFAGADEGSEYFRLAVEAYAPDLVGPISELARDSARPHALRLALVPMLGRARFRADPGVADTLLAVLRSNGSDELGLAALGALAVAGTPSSMPALEAALFALSSTKLRVRAIQVVIHFAGDHANAALARLLARAPDDPAAVEIIALLDTVDLDGALLLFQRASNMTQPVRLCAAQRIGEFAAQPFRDFVSDWLRVETDDAVIAALQQALHLQQTAPNWHARQTVGPPDSDPRRDDPHAWASAQADMGLQWLELRYATPMAANAVHIHEVNAPGAVVEVSARDAAGGWVKLWSSAAAAPETPAGGPLVIRFPTTSFAVRAVRVVVDTNRVRGWNEIDAVELVGPGGRQWAADASASSYYGQSSQRTERVLQTMRGGR